jgi:hypothetical protein
MELQEKLVTVAGSDRLSQEAQRNATLMLMAMLRASLNSKRVLRDYKLTPQAFDWLVGEIETRFNQARWAAVALCMPCQCPMVAWLWHVGNFHICHVGVVMRRAVAHCGDGSSCSGAFWGLK